MLSTVRWVRPGVAKAMPENRGLSIDELAELDAARMNARDLNAALEDVDAMDSDSDSDSDDEDEERVRRARKDEDEDEDEDDVDDAPVRAPQEMAIDENDEETRRVMEKYGLDDYDDDDDDVEGAGGAGGGDDDDDDDDDQDEGEGDDDQADEDEDGSKGKSKSKNKSKKKQQGGNIGGMFYRSNAEDPYLDDDADDDDDDDELADVTIRDTDALLLAAATDGGDEHRIDVFVYEPGERNLYNHHSVMVAAYPLALAWIGASLREPAQRDGNYVAVGLFTPGIEIWDLDAVNAMEPDCVLGMPSATTAGADAAAQALERLRLSAAAKGKQPSKNARRRERARRFGDGHEGPVLALAWNPRHRQGLASGSVDTAIKLWDVSRAACVRTLRTHTAEVHAVDWFADEPHLLLSGCTAGVVLVHDVRAADAGAAALRWKNIGAAVEKLAVSPHDDNVFAVACADGMVRACDRRRAGATLWQCAVADEKPCTEAAWNPLVRGMLATSSEDGMVRLWDVDAAAAGATGEPMPVCDISVGAEIGDPFSVQFCPSHEAPFAMAVAGGNNATPRVIHSASASLESVRAHFATRILQAS